MPNRSGFCKTFALLLATTVFFFHDAAGQEVRKRRIKQPDPPQSVAMPPVVERGTEAMIFGKVLDEVKGEPLPAATVKLTDGSRLQGVLTDDEGYFAFRNLAPGTYSLTFEFPEYQTVTLANIVLEGGDALNAGAVMKESIMELDAVLIQDRLNPSGDAAALLMQKTALAVSDGLSGDLMLKQSPDFQLSVPLQRLPGVSMNEDKYLSVRGLFERYNSFTINNAPIPVGVDPEQVGFDFSTIPSSVISGIRLLKTSAPDLISEFGGGYIQLNTVDIPAENSLRVFGQAYMNTRATFSEFKTTPITRRPLGIVKQVDNLPSDFPSSARLRGMGPQERADWFKRVNRNSTFQRFTAPPGTNFGVSVQRKFKVAQKEAGFTAYAGFLDYYRASEWNPNNNRAPYDTALRFNPTLDSSYIYVSRRQQNFTSMFNAGVRLDDFTKISFKNMFIYNSGNTLLDQWGRNQQLGAAGPGRDKYDLYYHFYLPLYRYNHSFTYIGQVSGEHRLFQFKNKRVVKGEWQLNYSLLDYVEPYYKGNVYGYDERNEAPRYLYMGQFENDYDYMLSLRMTTHLYGFQASASAPFHKNAFVQLGTFGKFTQSYGRGQRLQVAFDYDGEYQRTLLPEITDYSNIRNIFADENIGPGKINMWDVTTDYHNYDGKRQNMAPFAALHWGPSPQWRINAGVRGEYFRQSIYNLPVFDAPNRLVENDKFDLLPSLNMLYSPVEKLNLRLAYFETVIRPTEREMVPFEYLNPVTTLKTIGNPNITRTKMRNADFRTEYFFSGKEHVSFSVFYKFFTDPLEQQLTQGARGETSALNTYYMVTNQESALIAGVESEARILADRALPFHAYLKNFNLYFNLTLLQSRINASASPTDLFKPGRTLQGQANYVLNCGVLYTEPKTNINFNLFFNRIGNRISMVGLGEEVFASYWELSRNVLDLQIGITLKARYELRLSAMDVVNQPVYIVQLYEGRTSYDKNRDRIVRIENRGRSFFFTFSVRL